MARSKKAASDTVTFKKSELVQKIKNFLEEHDACEGDWLTKAKIAFFGLTESSIRVEVKIPAHVDLYMAFEGEKPTKEEVMEHMRKMMDEGEWCGFDSSEEEDFEVQKVTVIN